MPVETLEQLRALYPQPKGRAVAKQLPKLDPHCRRYISLSPFVVLSSCNKALFLDASPRGGPAGFVKTPDEHCLLIPDSPGNNRLDTLENIISTGTLGLLFMIPGVDETLRVNGMARLSRATEHLALFASEKHPPKLVIEVQVREAYLHCAKAFMRSRLWSMDQQLDRAALPSMGEMINAQTGSQDPVESQADMIKRYAADL